MCRSNGRSVGRFVGSSSRLGRLASSLAVALLRRSSCKKFARFAIASCRGPKSALLRPPLAVRSCFGFSIEIHAFSLCVPKCVHLSWGPKLVYIRDIHCGCGGGGNDDDELQPTSCAPERDQRWLQRVAKSMSDLRIVCNRISIASRKSTTQFCRPDWKARKSQQCAGLKIRPAKSAKSICLQCTTALVFARCLLRFMSLIAKDWQKGK